MNKEYPKISIVTPSFNQAEFLEEAIQSVLIQKYPNLEYIIIDGGSSDSSVEIIKKYEANLKYWVSEPDNGQYEAINKGFSHATGDIFAYVNSDDKYMPWTFSVVADIFQSLPEVKWLTSLSPIIWDQRGLAVECRSTQGYSKREFYRGASLPKNQWHTTAMIQQESTFWHRSLWEQAGSYMDTSLSLAADFELWARFYQLEHLYGTRSPLGGFRRHKTQKTANSMARYIEEAFQVLTRYGGRPYSKRRASWQNYLRRVLPGRVYERFIDIPELTTCVYDQNLQGWKIIPRVRAF